MQLKMTVPETVAFAAGLVIVTCANTGVANVRKLIKSPRNAYTVVILATFLPFGVQNGALQRLGSTAQVETLTRTAR